MATPGDPAPKTVSSAAKMRAASHRQPTDTQTPGPPPTARKNTAVDGGRAATASPAGPLGRSGGADPKERREYPADIWNRAFPPDPPIPALPRLWVLLRSRGRKLRCSGGGTPRTPPPVIGPGRSHRQKACRLRSGDELFPHTDTGRSGRKSILDPLARQIRLV